MTDNYELCDIPDSGNTPIVFMEIKLCEEIIGKLQIVLYREVFPAAVENFIKLITGTTHRVSKYQNGQYTYYKQTQRSYEGCKFFNFLYGNYIVTGDIYNNNGTTAGTIYYDEPIPTALDCDCGEKESLLGEYYYPHDNRGLVSLVPFRDELTGELFYDSTFMITLDKPRPTNSVGELDKDQIVIGRVCQGSDILDKINSLLFPYAGRKYPQFSIGKCGVHRGCTNGRRVRPEINHSCKSKCGPKCGPKCEPK